jgi:hypothetical protein
MSPTYVITNLIWTSLGLNPVLHREEFDLNNGLNKKLKYSYISLIIIIINFARQVREGSASAIFAAFSVIHNDIHGLFL